MNQRDLQEHTLEEDPTVERRWQALALNTQSWFERWAQARGEEVVSEHGMMWTQGQMTISSVDVFQVGNPIDQALEWYRGHHPLKGIICWYLIATPPGDLRARLLARGFEPNWQPHWMWCDLCHLPGHDAHSSTFDIQIVEDEPVWQVDDLPYYSVEDTEALAVLHRTYPRHIYSLIAFQEQRVVGRCMLNITTGEWGVAGVFDMGVVPTVRKQGIGTALAQAACELAQQRGCHHVVLNATPMGEPVYRRVGFQSMGYGHTWFLPAQTLTAPAPTRDQVRFLEAVGQGDIRTLNETGKRLEESVLRKPSLNGLTPLEIAVHCQQPSSAAWLVEHGVSLDLLSAWDLGWKEQVSALLVKHPELVNIPQGESHVTPLHIAIERGDIELMKLLLTVPNDLEIKDTEFQSTAIGWAQYFHRTEMIALLEQYRSSQRKLDR